VRRQGSATLNLGHFSQSNSSVARMIGTLEGGVSKSDQMALERDIATEIASSKRTVRGRVILLAWFDATGLVQLADLVKAKKALTSGDRRAVGSRPDRCKADHEAQVKRFDAVRAGESHGACARAPL
jgi:hypothetical protein